MATYRSRTASAKVRRQAAIDRVEQENRLPFLAFGGMDRRKDQIVFVEQRYAGLITGSVRWVERQLGKKPFPGGIAGSDLLQLNQIRPAGDGILMDTVEVR